MPVSFAVATKFTAVDKVSKTFKRMGESAEKFGRRSDKSFRRATRSANRFRDVTKGILAAGAINRGFAAIERGVATATTEFINFDQAVLSASAKFKGLDLATKEGQKTFEKLKKSARELAATTQFSAAQTAAGLDFLALAGFNAEQAMAALPGTVNLATVANIDLGRATDIATDSLGAFGLMTKDSIQLQKNLTRVNDVMAKTMATSNTSIEQLFEAVAAGATDFTRAGQSMESFSALAGIMANSGKKGEAAGTALRNVMVRLSAPTGEAAKILKNLGVVAKDQKGNFKDVVDILEDFQKGISKLGTAEKTEKIAKVFGLRAQGAVNILLSAGADEMRKYRKTLLSAAGASQRMADIMRTSILNRLKGLKSALIELSFKVFTRFEKRGISALDRITEAVRNFDPTPIINGLEDMIRLFKTANNLAGALGNTLNILSQPVTGDNFFTSMINLIDSAISKITALTQHINALLSTAVFDVGIIKDIALGNVGILDLFSDRPANFSEFTKRAEAKMGESSRELGRGISERRDERLGVERAEPPNKKEAAARAESNKSFLEGLFTFENAPQGMKFENKSKGSSINVAGLGTQ